MLNKISSIMYSFGWHPVRRCFSVSASGKQNGNYVNFSFFKQRLYFERKLL